MTLYANYQAKLDKLKTDFNFRSIKDIVQEGRYLIYKNKKLLNLSSNDYLGISINKDIQDNFLSSYTGKIQNPSARLLSGSDKIYLELEGLISTLLNKNSALLFNSGYHANVGIYSSLLTCDDVVFIDKLNHASIIDGIKLSGAKIIPFSHLDYSDLEIKLKKYRNNYKNSIISSETLFSMDGDFADFEKLYNLKKKYNSLLIADEAHSFGVYGKGRGYLYEKGMSGCVDLIMGTFGKAIGSYGAFAAGDSALIDYLINFARSFIFSTALPAISVSYSKFVLENYVLDSNLQDKLFLISNYAKEKINNNAQSYIIPYIAGDNKSALYLENKLFENGFFAPSIKYPTVKAGQARIRISLNPYIEKQDIDLINCTLKQAL